MKTLRQLAGLLALSLALASARAQTTLPPFGAAFTTPAGTTTYALPADGVLNYTRFTVQLGATVKFARNAANTPVYIIATGDVNILGVIDVSGSAGTGTTHGLSGPGGFDGGAPAIGTAAPGDGLGPGAGGGARAASGATSAIPAGHAGYGTSPTEAFSQNGTNYSNQLLMPLVGGSGGGGSSTAGGGGGGGAILIKSDTVINIVGAGLALGVRAWGGNNNANTAGGGSGGAIRLVAPIITGNGLLDVSGLGGAGHGRIRCDLTDRSSFAGLRRNPATAPFTSDQYLPLAFPPANSPTLRIVSVGTGANRVVVPPGSSTGFTITLPLNAPASQNVEIEAANFGTTVPIAIKLTPVSGASLPATELTIPSPVGGATTATLTIPLPFTANVPTTVNVWTR